MAPETPCPSPGPSAQLAKASSARGLRRWVSISDACLPLLLVVFSASVGPWIMYRQQARSAG